MRACGKTDVGLRRHENQDTFAVEQGEKLLIAVVCDGMGGAEGGQIASSVAVETFMKEMRALIRADMTAEQLRALASFCVAGSQLGSRKPRQERAGRHSLDSRGRNEIRSKGNPARQSLPRHHFGPTCIRPRT